MPTTVLRIPLLAPSLNGAKGLIRMHYRAYKKVREDWVLAVLAATQPSDRHDHSPCEVTIHRDYCPHALDLDNLYAAVKVPLDAMRHAGLLADDDPSCVTALSCTQSRTAHRVDTGTTITLNQ